jgi:hypothetical protein
MATEAVLCLPNGLSGVTPNQRSANALERTLETCFEQNQTRDLRGWPRRPLSRVEFARNNGRDLLEGVRVPSRQKTPRPPWPLFRENDGTRRGDQWIDRTASKRKWLNRERLTPEDGLFLLNEAPLNWLGRMAMEERSRRHPAKEITFIIDSNPNYTNICDNLLPVLRVLPPARRRRRLHADARTSHGKNRARRRKWA